MRLTGMAVLVAAMVLTGCTGAATSSPASGTGAPAASGPAAASLPPAASGATVAGNCLTVDQVKSRGGWDIIAPTADWPPYWFLDDAGKDSGMDVDLFAEVNKRLGLTVKSQSLIPYDGVLPAVASKQGDFIPAAITVTPERQQQWGFSPVYGDASIVVMTTPSAGIRSADDLGGKKVGAQTSSAGEAAAQELQKTLKTQAKDFAELKSYPNPSDAFLDLGNGRVDAVISARAPVQDWVNKHPGKFVVAGPVGSPLYAAWLFRLDDMSAGCIGATLTDAIKQIHSDGTMDTLQTKWFGAPIQVPGY
jgi:polar amino acid transport system substrate-binding protein